MKVTSVAFVPYIKFASLDAAYYQAKNHPEIDAEALPEGIRLQTDTPDGTEEIIVPWHEIRYAKSFTPKPSEPIAAPSPAGAQTNVKPSSPKPGKP